MCWCIGRRLIVSATSGLQRWRLFGHELAARAFQPSGIMGSVLGGVAALLVANPIRGGGRWLRGVRRWAATSTGAHWAFNVTSSLGSKANCVLPRLEDDGPAHSAVAGRPRRLGVENRAWIWPNRGGESDRGRGRLQHSEWSLRSIQPIQAIQPGGSSRGRTLGGKGPSVDLTDPD
jgi:hypothetical protein